MLVVGSSLLLLRGKPNPQSSPTQITQRGEPGECDEAPARGRTESRAKGDSPTPMAAPNAAAKRFTPESAGETMPQTMATATAVPPPPAAMPLDEAPAASASSGDAGDPKRDLAKAEALKNSAGCSAAVGQLQGIIGRYPNTPEGLAAQGELEKCKPASPAKPAASGLPSGSK
jgi:hypothetical protein